jgi:PEP-CTERM motif
MPMIHTNWRRWCRRVTAILVYWLICAPLCADASPLGLTTDPAGDVTTSSIDIEYTQSTGKFTANGTTDGYSYSVLTDTDYFMLAPVYTLTATLNPATGALISGTFEIDGSDGGLYSGILLKGTLTAFGFPNPTSSTNVPLEFTFDDLSGVLTLPGAPYAGMANAGTILHLMSKTAYFTSGWPAVNFDSQTAANIGNTNSDTFPIPPTNPTPEPSTFVLLAAGLLPLAWRLRRRIHVPDPV